MLPQNEIEELGARRESQLSLVDGFRAGAELDRSKRKRLTDAIAAATDEIAAVRAGLNATRDELANLGDAGLVQQRIDDLEVQLGIGATQTHPIRVKLDELTAQLAGSEIGEPYLAIRP